MKGSDKRNLLLVGISLSTVVCSCAPINSDEKVVPALEYARSLGGGSRQDISRAEAMTQSSEQRRVFVQGAQRAHAGSRTNEPRFRLAANEVTPEREQFDNGEVVTNIAPTMAEKADFQVHESTMPNSRDYNGPLSLGDPGVSASLWQESRGETSLFRDFRAWQPMDVITILVTENATGRKQADTNVKTESTFQAALNNILGYENDIIKSNSRADGTSKIDLGNLINASADSEYKGQGQTGRTDTLRAQLSAMVVEVLPGGVLRVEGERIISMNNEEQIMVISGLIRTRDINSDNQVDSARIANMRVDYFGRGSLGSAQYGGWLSNILRMLWPF